MPQFHIYNKLYAEGLLEPHFPSPAIPLHVAFTPNRVTIYACEDAGSWWAVKHWFWKGRRKKLRVSIPQWRMGRLWR